MSAPRQSGIFLHLLVFWQSTILKPFMYHYILSSPLSVHLNLFQSLCFCVVVGLHALVSLSLCSFTFCNFFIVTTFALIFFNSGVYLKTQKDCFQIIVRKHIFSLLAIGSSCFVCRNLQNDFSCSFLPLSFQQYRNEDFYHG